MTHGQPQPIAEILSELLSRRGYARQQSTTACAEAWRQAAGALIAEHTRPGLVRRGALEVMVANSALVQEITFRKVELVRELGRLLPEQRIENLKLRVGPIK